MNLTGWCPICEQEVRFVSYDSWLRDHLTCSNCSSIPRERAIMVIIQRYYPGWRELAIHESSPVSRGTSRKLERECKQYVPSQYFPGQSPGTIEKGFRNEDLEHQTFADGSFDLVITQDVFEHIYNPKEAFKEIARTLRAGGAHIFTVPILNRHKKTEPWAVKGEDGNPIFCKTPEWHTNPVDPEGSPVTMHWGFDIVSYIKGVSGLETEIEHIDDLHCGIRAELNEVLVTRKANPELK